MTTPLNYEPISLDRQEAYLRFFQICPQKTSDYSCVNLWAWAEAYGLCWAWDSDLVWIKQKRPEAVNWAPIGPWHTIDWRSRLTPPAPDGRTFVRVPEMLSQIWEQRFGGRLTIRDTRGSWDYLYSFEDLLLLKGNRFHRKKNLLNQFINKYPYAYSALGPQTISLALGMQKDWCLWRDCESSHTLSAENAAIERVLSQWDRLKGLSGGALTVDQNIAAYTVAEALSDEMILIHFEKADPLYKGGYQAINQLFLKSVRGEFRTVNREQDLDDEGLRQAKLSYHPSGFLRKYEIVFSRQAFEG